MDEVGGALIAIALVLCAVFVPAALHLRHLGPVLPPVRGDDRGLDRDLLLRLADAQPGAVRAAVQAARADASGARPPLPRPVTGVLQRLQPRLRPAVARLWPADRGGWSASRSSCSWSMRR